MTDVCLTEVTAQQIWDEIEANYTSLSRKIFGICFRTVRNLTGGYQIAEELTQDTFTRALERAETFHQQSTLSVWMYRIAFNLSVDRLRQANRQNTVSIEDQSFIDEEGVTVRLETHSDPERDQLELNKLIQIAFAGVPSRDTQVMLQTYGYGYLGEEVALSFGINYNTVKTIQHRTRRKCRDNLARVGVTSYPTRLAQR